MQKPAESLPSNWVACVNTREGLKRGCGLTKPDENDPATWTHSNAWPDAWQGFNANFADPNANFAVRLIYKLHRNLLSSPSGCNLRQKVYTVDY
jgi:hypothetical protein